METLIKVYRIYNRYTEDAARMQAVSHKEYETSLNATISEGWSIQAIWPAHCNDQVTAVLLTVVFQRQKKE